MPYYDYVSENYKTEEYVKMPYYDYVCENCKTEMIDTLQKINDPKLTKCPSCGKETLIRKIGQSAFHLKGSGWCESILENAGK